MMYLRDKVEDLELELKMERESAEVLRKTVAVMQETARAREGDFGMDIAMLRKEIGGLVGGGI